MQTDFATGIRSAWPRWAEFLRRHRLANLTTWALEAGGPLALLGAQLLYIGSPLLRPALSDIQRDTLATLLEDRDEAQAFAAFLREDRSQ